MSSDSLPQSDRHQIPVTHDVAATPRHFTVTLARFRRLLVTAVICGLVGAAAMSLDAFSDPRVVPALTHTIARGTLVVTIREQGLLESEVNYEYKSKVRGWNTVLWIIDSGTFVNKGDELVRLDSASIQEQIDERTKYSNWSQSSADRSEASVASAKLKLSEYDNGRYVAEKMTLETELVIAESRLRNALSQLKHTRVMARSGYLSKLEVEDGEFFVQQAKENVGLKQTQLSELTKFTRKKEMLTLSGKLKSLTARHQANAERAMADTSRRDRAVEEIQHCVIRAERNGLVIHPNAAKWESRPVEEGTNVHKNQVLLLMPDLEKMQVKIGVHESAVKRVTIDQQARVTFADGILTGKVREVASITKPAGWWTANEVRYDTMISLPRHKSLRPGMSADVDLIVAEYRDVLTIPVAAIVNAEDSFHCWVKTSHGPARREITLGDSNDVFTIVEAGLQEGDQVFLNPAFHEGPDEENAAPATDAAPQQPGAAGN